MAGRQPGCSDPRCKSRPATPRGWQPSFRLADQLQRERLQGFTFSPHNDGGRTRRFRVLPFGPGRLAIRPRNACTQSHVTPPRLAKSLGHNATKKNCTSHSSGAGEGPAIGTRGWRGSRLVAALGSPATTSRAKNRSAQHMKNANCAMCADSVAQLHEPVPHTLFSDSNAQLNGS